MFAGLKNYFSNATITLSGEILITVATGWDISLLQTFDRSEYRSLLYRLRGRYPFLRLEENDAVTELSIKLFALDKPFKSDNFLEDFNDLLTELARVILKEEGLLVRLNVFGKFREGKAVKAFRYLNNGDDVRYRITEETPLAASERFLSPLVKSLLLVLALLGLCAYQGYQFWQARQAAKDTAKTKVEEALPDKGGAKATTPGKQEAKTAEGAKAEDKGAASPEEGSKEGKDGAPKATEGEK